MKKIARKKSKRLHKSPSSKINWKVLITCLLIVFIISIIGSLFTTSSVNSQWYNSIKPSITPPSWVFPIAWTILYIMIAFSMYYAWVSSKNNKQRKIISILFTVNLLLNILWSILYFNNHNILGAFIDLILLWISIALLFFTTFTISRRSAYLLVPYFLWVTFAGILNYLSLNLI
jgi:tryptophan-rich sensory protein